MAEIPEHILRRSAEARARAEGRTVADVLAEMRGEAPPADEAGSQPSEAPAPPSAPETPAEQAAPAAAEPAPVAATATAPSGPVRDLAAESQEYGVPAPLLRRAALARARSSGEPPPTIAGEAPAAAAPVPVAAASGGGAAAAAPAAAPAIPEGVRTQRLLTVVKAGAIQQVKTEPTDKVSTWPHLVAAEFVALMVCTAALFVFSVFVDAPLLEFANFNAQPNPSKAPWYFLGLQELLSYFDPQVAGVIIPGFGLAGLAIIPYIDRNPSVRPSDRKLAIMIFSFFLFAAAILTIYGSFFRGPGFNFTFPWDAGIFFDF
jgi:quinol---cytochrome c reductase cytochrome c subunit, bacillus type